MCEYMNCLSVSLPVVQMPSDQYTLELSNTTVASLDKEISRVTGMILGDTEIVLHDKSKNLKELYHSIINIQCTL